MSASASEKYSKQLKVVFAMTASYFVIEVIAGFLTNSLALLSDAAHMLTDVGGQALALFAIWMSSWPRNNHKTYGYYRVEILSALTNALVLIFISVFIFLEAWQRFKDPPSVAAVPMLIVAFFGLIINVISINILRVGSKESINIKGVFFEVISDMLSSIAVVIAGIIVLATGWLYIDPIMSALIGLFIFPRAFSLLKESVDILLEAVPPNIDFTKVEEFIKGIPAVKTVHDLHIWTITSGIIALSAHIIMKEGVNNQDIDESIQKIKTHLNSVFKISHTTLEVHKENKKNKEICLSNERV